MNAHARLEEIVRRLDIDTRVPEEVHAEVAALTPDANADNADLEDFRGLPFVTIDNEDSRDLDQALYLEREPDGWAVYYALADAAHFVRPGMALFEQSLRRGVSYYFPTFAIPMLPEKLSEGIISLNADVDRRALVFVMHVRNDGPCETFELRRGVIRSRAKLSYDGVQRYFDGAPDPTIRGSEFEESLQSLREVGEVRVAFSQARGVIEFDRTEARVVVRADGASFGLSLRQRNDVERWNEQVSLLCNIMGARFLQEHGHQPVFRVHLPPMRSRLDELREIIGRIVARHGLGDAWRWTDEPLADYLTSLPEAPEHSAVRRAIELQVRYTNRASQYSDRAGRHYALAVDQYARFSSPMREVVGIFTHKEAFESLGWRHDTPVEDEILRDRVIASANEGRSTQKRIDKEVMLLAIDDLLQDDLALPLERRPRRTAIVIGLRPSRVYVLLEDLPLELKIYADDLEEQFGTAFQLRHHELVPQSGRGPTFGHGDRLSLVVRGHEPANRRWSFEIQSVG